MLKKLQSIGVTAAVLFVAPIAFGQEIGNGGNTLGEYHQFSDQQPIYVPLAVGCDSSSQYARNSGRQCYGGCDGVQYEQSCESCGSPSCAQECQCALSHDNCLIKNMWQTHHEYYQYEPNLLCPGDRLYALLEPQKANGRAAQLAFYSFHFQWDGQGHYWHLSESGWNNVQKLLRILPITPGTILVDPTGNPQADASRAQVVRDAFASGGQVAVSVAVGKPSGVGLTGPEALNIYQQRQLGSPYHSATSGGVGLSSGVGLGSGQAGVGNLPQ
jgi:hypothetical protein